MSERTGLGVVEIALLEALETSRFLRCDKALASVEERIGLAPGYAYEVLVDLARPWTMPVNLVQGQGNFGSRGNDPPANFRYTEARVTRAGRAALAAERGEMAPLPITVINGNTYREGLRPPFRPHAVIDAVREAISLPGVTDAELTGMVGLPYFLTGCTVDGDLTALAAGRRTELSLQAQVSISDYRRTVVIENIPPNISTDDTASIIASRATAPPMGQRPSRPSSHHPPATGRPAGRNVRPVQPVRPDRVHPHAGHPARATTGNAPGGNRRPHHDATSRFPGPCPP